MNDNRHIDDSLAEAARREAQRARQGRRQPEPSLGSRLCQIGVLGWMIVIPTLCALWLGRKIDQLFSSGIMFSAALLIVGAALGLWFAWRWMHNQ